MFKAALELEEFLVFGMDKMQVRRERRSPREGWHFQSWRWAGASNERMRLREEMWPGNLGEQGKSWSHPTWNIAGINGNWGG